MRIHWTNLPFPARNEEEFRQGLTRWLGQVFYEELPANGYEIREEQIYATFRIARALTTGATLLAEAGPGTGKTFAYLLPAVCYARFRGAPVVVACATDVLQAQMAGPGGDIETLSRVLNLGIKAVVAEDPSLYICQLKVQRPAPARKPPGWDRFREWAEQTSTGARSEVPDVPDALWEQMAWEPSLPCDTCPLRSHCHVVAARRRYREEADLILCDHRLFGADLLSRTDRLEEGRMPLLPPYSAVVLDEGHHMAETWQRVQGHRLDARRLKATLDQVEDLLRDQIGDRPAILQAVDVARHRLARFVQRLEASAARGEGKRAVARTDEVLAAAAALDSGLEQVEEVLVTEEAMREGLEEEEVIRAYQARLDEVRAALRMFRSDDSLVWLEGRDLWTVPREPVSLFGPGRLQPRTPVIFSSATLEPEYQARILRLKTWESFRVGVPFNVAEQELIYFPATAGDPIRQVCELLQVSRGRALILLPTREEVQRYRQVLSGMSLPWRLLFEGEGDRRALLARFREDVSAVLVGSSFWEGVDVPGESLSCCIIPRLPFPEHDPLIQERRRQAEREGADPFHAVDLPEMLIRLRQGFGRLIRTARDRGVIALLDLSFRSQPWAEDVLAALPEGVRHTSSMAEVAAFLGTDPGEGEVPGPRQEPSPQGRN
ncbi:MAG TPA: ATP-dependent DNA helicase [Symbiobacteriaceae bacterium]